MCELKCPVCAINVSYNDVFEVFLHLVVIRPIIWSACHFSLIGKLVGGRIGFNFSPCWCLILALFPSLAQLSVACRIRFSISQAAEHWAEPGNKASLILHDSPGVKVVIITKLSSIVNSRFYAIQSAILGYCSDWDCGWCDSGWCVNCCDLLQV